MVRAVLLLPWLLFDMVCVVPLLVAVVLPLLLRACCCHGIWSLLLLPATAGWADTTAAAAATCTGVREADGRSDVRWADGRSEKEDDCEDDDEKGPELPMPPGCLPPPWLLLLPSLYQGIMLLTAPLGMPPMPPGPPRAEWSLKRCCEAGSVRGMRPMRALTSWFTSSSKDSWPSEWPTPPSWPAACALLMTLLAASTRLQKRGGRRKVLSSEAGAGGPGAGLGGAGSRV